MQTAVRALLLTDVVDSTRLTEALGDVGMAELWARHDRLARDLLAVHRGQEIDKTDGFLLLFDAAVDAVAYAVAYHRALRDLDLSSRVGLHVGEVVLTPNHPDDVARGAKPLEVDGLAKPLAARVMSVASGGQTLLTPAALAAVGATRLRVESHGHWRMKGVAEPIELFEIGERDGSFTPPLDGAKVYRVVEREGLWLPARDVPRSLPAERDAFVGRQADLSRLARAVDDSRLVSVLGVGGTGKTRLVTRFGWLWLGDYPGGVWFCDLSEARSVEGIVAAVARALDVPLGSGDPVARLGHALAGRGACLVVLDNFEQVARFAPETLDPWLDRAGDARFVVTTREVLGLSGEAAVPLAPLESSESVELFAARARMAWPQFVADDPDTLRALVRLLDGLPLAIELAAARVRVMPPKMLLARMSERFKLLASRGARHTRQATLRGALDWSWDLLEPDERSALAQLSVFEGGFTLEAAEGVLALEGLWPMDAVQALVDKSLVRRLEAERFDLLVSVQEYASEQLDALGGRAAAEARHAVYFGGFGTPDAIASLDRRGGVAPRRALFLELDNLMAACRRCVAAQDGVTAVLVLRAAWAVVKLRGPHATAAALAEEVLAVPGIDAAGRIVVHRVWGESLLVLGQTDQAEVHYQAALALAREAGDRFFEAVLLGDLGIVNRDRGRGEATRAILEEALVAAQAVGDARTIGVVQHSLGSLDREQGRHTEAQTRFDAVLATHRAMGDRRSEGLTLGNIANLYREQGRLAEALVACESALAIHREVGNRFHEAAALTHRASLLAELNRPDEALETFGAALAIHRQLGSRPSEGLTLANLGVLHRSQGNAAAARACLDPAARIAREGGDLRLEAWILAQLAGLHIADGALVEAARILDQAEALLGSLEDPVILPLLLLERARLYGRQGEVDAALQALARAEALTPEGHPVRTTIAEARASLVAAPA